MASQINLSRSCRCFAIPQAIGVSLLMLNFSGLLVMQPLLQIWKSMGMCIFFQSSNRVVPRWMSLAFLMYLSSRSSHFQTSDVRLSNLTLIPTDVSLGLKKQRSSWLYDSRALVASVIILNSKGMQLYQLIIQLFFYLNCAIMPKFICIPSCNFAIELFASQSISLINNLMVIKACFIALSFKNGKIYRLIQPIACGSIHSFSGIYAVSNYLVAEAPNTFPPMAHDIKMKTKENVTQNYNPFFQAWNDYLKACIIQGRAFRNGNNFYIEVPLQHEQQIGNAAKYKEVLMEQSQNIDRMKRLSHIFGIDAVRSQRKMGIYLMHAVNEKKLYTSRLNISAIWLGLLFNNQKWSIFDIPKGSIPTVEQLCQFDTIIITGGSYSAIDKPTPVQIAIKNLGDAYKHSQKLKIVGTCYGHQLIAQYFGAKVTKKQTIAGLQSIHFNQNNISKYKSLAGLYGVSSLLLSQYHDQCLVTAPQGFDLLSGSQNCGVQCIVSKDERILSCQFHSQLPYDFIQSLMAQQRKAGQCNWVYTLNECQARINRNIEDSQIFLQAIRQFIDY